MASLLPTKTRSYLSVLPPFTTMVKTPYFVGNIRMWLLHSRFAPSQWEMVLLCNDVSHWLDASLKQFCYCSYKDTSYFRHSGVLPISLWPSDAMWLHGTWSPLFQIMSYRLFGTKPLPDIMLIIYNIRNKLQINFNQNTAIFLQENVNPDLYLHIASTGKGMLYHLRK